MLKRRLTIISKYIYTYMYCDLSKWETIKRDAKCFSRRMEVITEKQEGVI